MAASATLDGRVSRLEEAEANAKDYREESRQDRRDILAEIKELKTSLNAVAQSVQSTGDAVQRLSLEKCGERLDKCEMRLSALENRTQNLPTIETEVMFWRRVLGGGFRALWKIAAVILGSGTAGALIAKFL